MRERWRSTGPVLAREFSALVIAAVIGGCSEARSTPNDGSMDDFDAASCFGFEGVVPPIDCPRG